MNPEVWFDLGRGRHRRSCYDPGGDLAWIAPRQRGAAGFESSRDGWQWL